MLQKYREDAPKFKFIMPLSEEDRVIEKLKELIDNGEEPSSNDLYKEIGGNRNHFFSLINRLEKVGKIKHDVLTGKLSLVDTGIGKDDFSRREY